MTFAPKCLLFLYQLSSLPRTTLFDIHYKKPPRLFEMPISLDKVLPVKINTFKAMKQYAWTLHPYLFLNSPVTNNTRVYLFTYQR